MKIWVWISETFICRVRHELFHYLIWMIVFSLLPPRTKLWNWVFSWSCVVPNKAKGLTWMCNAHTGMQKKDFISENMRKTAFWLYAYLQLSVTAYFFSRNINKYFYISKPKLYTLMVWSNLRRMCWRGPGWKKLTKQG